MPYCTIRAQPMNQASLSIVKDVYQIRFLIHEARQLTHTPCDPVVVLTIGKETKSTQICEDSIDPVYNEVQIVGRCVHTLF